MPEISEQELATLKNSYNLLQKLDSDPRSKPLVERAVKIHHPEVVTEEELGERLAAPHIEKVNAVATELRDQLEALKQREAGVAQREQENAVNSAFTRLESAGYTPDGIGAIKQLMVDRKIADPEAAAALFDKMNPPAATEAPGWVPDRWNFDETASAVDVKGLFKNEDKWADDMVGQVLNEIRVGKAAA